MSPIVGRRTSVPRRRSLAFALALALIVPPFAPVGGIIEPSTSGAAEPTAQVGPPARRLRPGPGMADLPTLREATPAELEAARLVPGTGPCAGIFQDAGADGAGRLPARMRCSHGPDGVMVAAASGPPLLDEADDYVPPPIPCFTTGPFVKVFYVYQSGDANHLSSLRGRILRAVAGVDVVVDRSAASVGLAVRHVRWLMDGNCDLSITAVALPASHVQTISPFPILFDLVDSGRLASNQKALVFTEDATAGPGCSGIAGIASVEPNDSPLASNPANAGRSIARVFGWCLRDTGFRDTGLAGIAAHEVMHTLGAVQDSAPHSSHYGHCTDGDDVMCYEDGPGVVLQSICAEEFPRSFDCNKDDYFNPSPPAGSYLATHWNTANNIYLTATTPTSTSTTAPLVTITAPAAGATASGAVTLSASTGPAGAAISRVDFYVNGTFFESDATAPYGVSMPTDAIDGVYPFPNGALTIDAVATDTLGRWRIAPSVALQLGNPRVALVAPSAAAVVTGLGAWSAEPSLAPGRTVAKIELIADDTVVDTDTTAPYGGTWSPDMGADQIELRARVTDSAGSVGESRMREVFPRLAELTLAVGGATAGSPVALLAAPSPTSFVPIQQVDFYRQPLGGGAMTLIGSDTSAPFAVTWTPSVAGDVQIVARPIVVGGGAPAGTDATRTLHVGLAQPGFSISLDVPGSGATVVGPSVALAATPTAPAGWTVEAVEFEVDGASVDWTDTAPWTGSWGLDGIGTGAHLVSATATFVNEATFDAVDLSSAGTVVVRAGPTVAIGSPAAGSSVGGTVTVRADVTPATDDPISFVKFYAGAGEIGSDREAPFEVSWETDASFGSRSGFVELRAIAYGSSTSQASEPSGVTVSNGSVALVAPSTGAVIAGRTTLSATATWIGDLDAERLTFSVDGVPVASDDVSPFAVEWNSATVALGAHSVTAAASYGDGTSRISPARAIFVIVPGGPSKPVAHIGALPAWLAATSVGVTWSATASPVAAVTSYDVRYRRAAWNGAFGAYAVWLSATPSLAGTFGGSVGSTYCFSARARDAVGQVSAWTGESCTSFPLDDRSLTRNGSWQKQVSSSYYRGTYLSTKTTGRSLTRTGVVARRIALVATVCPSCGKVKVYWGSTLLKTVNLYAAKTTTKKLITIVTFGSVRTGTLKIKVTSSGKSVRIDGVAIRRVP